MTMDAQGSALFRNKLNKVLETPQGKEIMGRTVRISDKFKGGYLKNKIETGSPTFRAPYKLPGLGKESPIQQLDQFEQESSTVGKKYIQDLMNLKAPLPLLQKMPPSQNPGKRPPASGEESSSEDESDIEDIKKPKKNAPLRLLQRISQRKTRGKRPPASGEESSSEDESDIEDVKKPKLANALAARKMHGKRPPITGEESSSEDESDIEDIKKTREANLPPSMRVFGERPPLGGEESSSEDESDIEDIKKPKKTKVAFRLMQKLAGKRPPKSGEESSSDESESEDEGKDVAARMDQHADTIFVFGKRYNKCLKKDDYFGAFVVVLAAIIAVIVGFVNEAVTELNKLLQKLVVDYANRLDGEKRYKRN